MHTRVLLSAILLRCGAAAAAPPETSDFSYLSPLPGSTLVPRTTNIIVRRQATVGRELLPGLARTEIRGSSSGFHSARCTLAADGSTVLWVPDVPFTAGEQVTVTLPPWFHGRAAESGKSYAWSFTVSPSRVPSGVAATVAGGPRFRAQAGVTAGSGADSVPATLPAVRLLTSDHPSAGSLFLAAANATAGTAQYAMIVDNSGVPVAYRSTAPLSCDDFKVQPNGLLSYAVVRWVDVWGGLAQAVEMVTDSTFAVIDSFQCGNGYTTDPHEFRMLPNGHAIMLAYDPEYVDMSLVVPGGNPDAIVYGSIIQELDEAKNVVFQWRSWDYVPITDCYDDLTAPVLDYIHVNAIDVDTDGNLLVSCRETSTILKIDRFTGDVVWRLGGKRSQFMFYGEHAASAPNYFSFQHDVRRIANGHITLMDNGNQHAPPYSRAVEYALDETAMTATLVWEYRHAPDVFNPAAGSVQRLPGGNTMIGWGNDNLLGSGIAALTEVRPDGGVALEMSLPAGLFSYRALKFPWTSDQPSASVSVLDMHFGVPYRFASDTANTGVAIQLASGDAMYSRTTVARYPYAPHAAAFNGAAPAMAPVRISIVQAGFASFSALVTFDTSVTTLLPFPARTTVYARPTAGSGTFAPLATTFDSLSRTLSVSVAAYGEFAFGWTTGTGVVQSPVLIGPANGGFVNKLAPVSFSWSARGRATGFALQIAYDSLFAAMNADVATAAPGYTIPAPLADTSFYWRVRATGDSGVSQWSGTWRCSARAPFINITYPSGGETLYWDSVYVVRWTTNDAGGVRITLTGGVPSTVTLADSAPNTGAFLFVVPEYVRPGTGYVLTVKSLADTGAGALTQAVLAIASSPLASVSAGTLPPAYALHQNYPNPFNPSTTIRYDVPVRSAVHLELYNTLGQRVALLVDGMEEAGYHEVRLDAGTFASGVYLYRLTAHAAEPSGAGRNYVETRKLLLIR